MPLKVTCFYCGAQKELHSGGLVKLSCDRCSSARVILDQKAVFRCNLCGRKFVLPGGEQVKAFHAGDGCRGRSLVLLDYGE
ncbi:MAG: hypothetical protein AB1896_16850 [Thermodesulfobacteriota bacterium]